VEPANESARDARPGFLHGDYRTLVKRGITEDTCRKWGYRVANFNGKTVQVADYRDGDGVLVAQKVRFPNKDFTVVGDLKRAGLFGQNIWRDGGKMIVVTEGEIDALTVSQLQGNKWPVVSVPNGAQGALKAIKKALDYLLRFESVIFMFDMDEPGRQAALACSEVLPPGRAKIASLPLKDASECLQQGKGAAVVDAIWSAKVARPDGIIDGTDLWQEVTREDNTVSVPYPWETINEKTYGLRRGELVTLAAGSGVGKSALCREIEHYLLKRGERVGVLHLEESSKRTALGLVGIELNKPLHLSRDGVTEAQLREAFDATVGSGRLFLYDHFGSTEIDNLINRMRYLVRGCDCGWIILDHLSIVISGLDDGDERKLIDTVMTRLRTLVQETGCGLILVSHLKRPDGKGHEEGAKTSLSQLRGSHAIAQLSDMVIGAERDQQGENPNVMLLRILKNRFSGETGEACWLRYDRETGRLSETDPVLAGEATEDQDSPF
jgi:twinkle protein